jgi:hypothetical protein
MNCAQHMILCLHQHHDDHHRCDDDDERHLRTWNFPFAKKPTFIELYCVPAIDSREPFGSANRIITRSKPGRMRRLRLSIAL